MEEIWKDIKDYPNYQVSNLGRVKSLKNNIILRQHNNNKYYQVFLYKNKKRKMFFVHRLVAETFIPNPNHLPCINHKSEITSENNIDNLEWCSYKYNNNYGNRINKIIKKESTPIKCLDLKTNEITYYSSINECARHFNVSTIWYSVYKCKSPYKNRYVFTEIKE